MTMEVQDLILAAYKISHPLDLLTTNIYLPIKKTNSEGTTFEILAYACVSDPLFSSFTIFFQNQ